MMPLSVEQINALVRTPQFTRNCWGLIDAIHQLRGLPALPKYAYGSIGENFGKELASGRWKRCKHAPHWGIARVRSAKGGHLVAIEGTTVLETTANNERVTASPLTTWQAKQAAPVRYYRRVF